LYSFNIEKDNAMPSSKKTFLKSQPKDGLTLREIFTRPLIYGTDPSSPRWSSDGNVLAFLWNKDGEPRRDIFISAIDKPEPVKLTDSASVEPLPVEDDERPEDDVAYAEVMYGGISEFDWLTKNDESEKEIVYICRGNLFRINISGGDPIRLTKCNLGINRLQVSPDGRRIGFMMNSNIWAYDTVTGSINQLTFFGKKDVSVRNFSWSPDSKWISIIVTDTSMYETIKMPDYSPEKEVKINELRRNNAGKPREKARFGIVSAEGGKFARITIPDLEKTNEKDKDIDTGVEMWMSNFAWTPDSSKLLIIYTGDNITDYHLLSVEPGQESETVELYTEKLEPWTDWSAPIISPDSKYVYFCSYKSGWRRIYRVPVTGGELQELTHGDFDVCSIQIPKKGSQLLYTANAPYPAEQQVFAMPLDGGDAVQISPKGFTMSSVFPSDDGKSLAFISSAVMIPAELFVQREGKEPIKVTSSPLSSFAKIKKPKVERFTYINESDGAKIYARMILPHNFDPSKKYPVVLTCIYAGQSKEGFGRYQMLDTYMANEMGYILVGVDLRASMGYGKDFFYGYHKKLGIIDADECASCANYLKTLPYVDGERVGIWGGSYGGFLTLMIMCNHPGVFHTGISWKPVTDWRNYWDGYIAPRLTRPEDDPEIYKATSPVFHANKLEGNLLLVHGMLDDNVLFQDAVWMIQKLIEAGKYFDLAIYPRDDHGLTLRHESLPDCMERFAAYFEEHMGLGPV
jgi:dipeptidyl-peptidase-4